MSDEKTPEPASKKARKYRGSHPGAATLARGEPMIWLTGGALLLALAMIIFLLAWIAMQGLTTFWPQPVVEVELHDGSRLVGEVAEVDTYQATVDDIVEKSDEVKTAFVDSLIDRISSWDGLEDSIQSHVNKLDSRLALAKSELDLVSTRVDSIKSEIGDNPESAYLRRDLIAENSQTTQLDEALTKLDDWNARVSGLEFEIESAKAAKEYFAKLEVDRSNSKAIFDAPYESQVVGLRGLLDLVEKKTGRAITIRQRKIRTGNRQLTGVPFHWVADYEVVRETKPEDVWLLERVSWGRFYGNAQQSSVLHSRDVSEIESQLAGALATLDGSEDTHQEAKSAVEQKLAELREKAATSLLGQIERVDGDALVALDDSGQETVLESSTTGDPNVVAIRQQFEGSGAAWQLFEKNHGETLEKFAKSQHLSKHEIGHWYRLKARADLRIKQAQLDDQTQLEDLAENYAAALAETNDLTSDMEELDGMLKTVTQEFAQQPKAIATLQESIASRRSQLEQQVSGQKKTIGEIDSKIEKLPQRSKSAINHFVKVSQEVAENDEKLKTEIKYLTDEIARYQIEFQTASDQTKTIAFGDIVRGYQPNRLQGNSRWRIYWERWREFLTEEPREGEGGVLPCIWGTVVMTLIMSLAVVPFGVLAALYLREYAKAGPIVSAVRIAINNLAGVPSVVFGVFGLGFFCYRIGSYIDGGPTKAGFQPWESRNWLICLAALAIVSVAGFFFGISSLSARPGERSAVKRWFARFSLLTWVVAFGLFVALLMYNPFFDGFYQAKLPDPTWGKGGVLWASLTLALLTLPVVIVATEESLAAVPNSMREGSYGCGASKWQTIRRIILPHALPGIMTGMILAMARGAGEVAPLMLVGVVALAPELPIDGVFPFVHGERSFMHLGYHIYALGFQSPDADAAKPMVYTTTLLLIGIITILNVSAVWLRTMLRRRFRSGQF